ncbi:MAG: hypothetical protein FWE84_01945, partial [Firmicutes bacterium]|nr:hypothetical protein [Bacillota bacterium]
NCNRIALLVKGELKGVFTPAELYANSHLIEENGLEMPAVFRIARELNRRGYVLRDIKNTVDLVDKIAEQWSGVSGQGSGMVGVSSICHSERSEESLPYADKILRCAQDDNEKNQTDNKDAHSVRDEFVDSKGNVDRGLTNNINLTVSANFTDKANLTDKATKGDDTNA